MTDLRSLSPSCAAGLPHPEPRRRIMLVEPGSREDSAIDSAFASGAWEIESAGCGREARALLNSGRYDAVIIDPYLADIDGFELVRTVTRDGTGTLVLVREDDYETPRRAIESGAADFIYKPVRGSELRVRLDRFFAGGPAPGELREIFVLDRRERVCRIGGRTIALTRHERDFLACLLDSPGRFAPYRALIEAVWGQPDAVERQHLRVLAAQVRRKVDRGPGHAELIQTVTGEGYRLAV